MNTDKLTKFQTITNNPNATLMQMCEVLADHFLVTRGLIAHPARIMDGYKDDHGRVNDNQALHYMDIVKVYRRIKVLLSMSVNSEDYDYYDEEEEFDDLPPVSTETKPDKLTYELRLKALEYCKDNSIELTIYKYDDDPFTGFIEAYNDYEVHLYSSSDSQVQHDIFPLSGIKKIKYFTGLPEEVTDKCLKPKRKKK